MSKLIAFRLPDALRERLGSYCAREKLGASEAVRQILDEALSGAPTERLGHDGPKSPKLRKQSVVKVQGCDVFVAPALAAKLEVARKRPDGWEKMPAWQRRQFGWE